MKEGSKGERTIVTHLQWTGLLGTELERDERREVGGARNILWAKELLKSNNLRENTDYVILKGTNSTQRKIKGFKYHC